MPCGRNEDLFAFSAKWRKVFSDSARSPCCRSGAGNHRKGGTMRENCVVIQLVENPTACNNRYSLEIEEDGSGSREKGAIIGKAEILYLLDDMGSQIVCLPKKAAGSIRTLSRREFSLDLLIGLLEKGTRVTILP